MGKSGAVWEKFGRNLGEVWDKFIINSYNDKHKHIVQLKFYTQHIFV